jgi:hypothetical protein
LLPLTRRRWLFFFFFSSKHSSCRGDVKSQSRSQSRHKQNGALKSQPWTLGSSTTTTPAVKRRKKKKENLPLRTCVIDS